MDAVIKYVYENSIADEIGIEPGDIIVLAGKGHEDYQILKNETIHFDEREVIKDILSKM